MQSTGARGVYELTLIEKVSRTLDRFMTEAERCERITDGLNVPQTEKLVSKTLLNELKFWRSLMNNSPLYGADVAGSLFDKGVAWNLVEI